MLSGTPHAFASWSVRFRWSYPFPPRHHRASSCAAFVSLTAALPALYYYYALVVQNRLGMITSCLTRSLRSLLVEGNSVTISAFSFFLLRCCCASSYFYSCCASSRFHSCFPSMPGRYRQRFHSGESIQIISLSPVINTGAETKRSENFHISDFILQNIFSNHWRSSSLYRFKWGNLFQSVSNIYFKSPSRTPSPYCAKGDINGRYAKWCGINCHAQLGDIHKITYNIRCSCMTYIYNAHMQTHDDDTDRLN